MEYALVKEGLHMLNWKRTPGTVKKRARGEIIVFERRREREAT